MTQTRTVVSQGKGFLLFALLAIYVLAGILQNKLFINWDIAYFMQASQLLLAGGTYSQNFFTPNPPLVFYLSLPALFLSWVFNWSLWFSFEFYLYVLSSLSLGLCYFLGKKILAPKEEWLLSLVLPLLATGFLILPMHEFGQREVLLLIFCLPYCLLLTYRLQGGRPRPALAFLIGLYASLGFGLKPHFLVTPLLLELYYAYQQKRLLAWWRPEVLAFTLFLACYGLSSLVFYPDYWQVVLPFVLRNYVKAVGVDWSTLLNNKSWLAVYCLLALLFSFFQQRNALSKALTTILNLCLLSFIALYFLQYKTGYYHLLPAFALSLLLSVLGLAGLMGKPRWDFVDYGFCLVFAILQIYWLGSIGGQSLWTVIIISPALYFCIFALIFTGLLLIMHQARNILKDLLAVALMIGLGYLFYFFGKGLEFFSRHLFALTTLLLSLLFTLGGARTYRSLFARYLVLGLSLLLFFYPLGFSYQYFSDLGFYKRTWLKDMQAFLQTYPEGTSLYSFSLGGNLISPVFLYTHHRFAQSPDCLWPLKAIAYGEQTEQSLKDEKFLRQLVAEDFHRQQPRLVFVKMREQEMSADFDYIRYFSQNKNFREEWKAYHPLKTFKGYQVLVYERKT